MAVQFQISNLSFQSEGTLMISIKPVTSEETLSVYSLLSELTGKLPIINTL